MGHVDMVDEFRRELPFYLRCSPLTAEKSAHHVAAFLRSQTLPFPECLTREAVMGYLSHLRATPPRRRDKEVREASTVNGHLKSLKRFAKWAVARDFMAEDPIEKIKKLKERDQVLMAPELDAMIALFQAAAASKSEFAARNYAMLAVLADTAIRSDELLSMDVSDVVTMNGDVRDHSIVHGKGDRDRMVALTPEIQMVIRRYLPERLALAGERALWVSEKRERMTYVALNRMLTKLCRVADIPPITLHGLRRFALTEMWRDGISETSAMLISGHRDTRVYHRYIRGAMIQRAMDDQRTHSPIRKVHAAG